MKLLLKRIAKKPTYTIGKLYVDDKYFCDTLEDTDRGLTSNMTEEAIKKIKIPSKTAIPTGTYSITMNVVSPRFKDKSWAKPYGGKLPRLLNVKGFDGVLIHIGNTDADSSGCLLVGENKQVGRLINSINTFNKLMKILTNSTNITIEIK